MRPVRPRYGRLAALGTAVAVTGIAMLGGTGVLSSGGASGTPEPESARDPAGVRAAAEPTPSVTASGTPPVTPSATPSVVPSVVPTPEAPASQAAPDSLAVPAGSGEGRRIVFDQSAQRVWLVGDGESVERTYLVSGSLTDNLQPGEYEVFSRSANAFGVDDAGTMRWFVRFTRGPQGGAIGFHDIPVDDGKAVQTTAELGTPQSHGCVRQARKDAIALWGFAPLGTAVSVVA